MSWLPAGFILGDVCKWWEEPELYPGQLSQESGTAADRLWAIGGMEATVEAKQGGSQPSITPGDPEPSSDSRPPALRHTTLRTRMHME